MITKRFFINYVSVHASIKLSNMTNCSESYSTTHGRPRLTAGNPTFFSAKFPAGLVLKKVTRALVKMDDYSQGWVETGFSRDKTIRDRDKILKFETRNNRDSHFAGKTRREFQEFKNFSSRQVKKISFSKISRQDKTRQDSCQEKSRNIQDKINFCLIWVMKLENFA